MMYSHSIYTSTLIDRTFRTFQDEGVYPPGFGTYHMYHRIDGELAAIGVLDITKEFVDSCYFIQNPKFMFLNLGVVGAIREIEYMWKLKKNFNEHLKIY